MSASRAFLNAFNERALVPDELFDWDEYASRLFRYHHYESYYQNTIYSTLSTYAQQHKNKYGLYQHTRGVYNPVARQNNLLVSSIYGGSIDFEHMTGGAIPLVFDNAALEEALRNVFIWSRFNELKSLYVRWGANLGDVALKIVDDRQAQKVRMEILHPGKIRDAEFDSVGNVKAVTIEYERDEETPPGQPTRFGILSAVSTPKTYLYTERITQEKFETFKDGEPFAYYNDANGNPTPAWDNEYGFVPLVIANHKETGLRWGANSFHNVTRKIDEVNDFASLLNDQVRKSVNVLWYFAGVRQASQLEASSSVRDEVPAIYGPPESQPHAMIANLPIDQALAALQEMLSELERDMPELALQRIRESTGAQTAPGVRAQYSDAIGRITEARGNYDAALVRGLQMAVSVGGYNRYDGFAGFDLNSYDAGELDFYIKDRPVIGDSLSVTERLTVLGSVGDKPAAIQKLILKELDFSADEIDEVITDIETEKQANMQQAQAQQNANGAANTDPNAAAADDAAIEDIWTRVGLPTRTPANVPAVEAAA